jgi:PII-like signaling protein
LNASVFHLSCFTNELLRPDMEEPQVATLLRVFIGEADRAGVHSLYWTILTAAHKAGLAGATVLHGPVGYGQTRFINNEFNVDAPGNLPTVVEIIDAEAKIEAFLPQLDPLIGSGLMTLEVVRMARIGRQTKGPAELRLSSQVPSASGQIREDEHMEVPHEAVLLRIFTGSDDRYGIEEPLYLAIVVKAREMHLAGATVLKGPIGYGQSTRMHEAHLLATDERPVVIEICDSEEKINSFLPVLDGMMESGLVTLEKARVIQYGRKRSGYLERLKKSVRDHLHLWPPVGKPS